MRSTVWYRIVQYQPMQSKFLHGIRKLIEIDGFANITVVAESVTFDDMALLYGWGKHH
jgi:hypothetical protein